MSMTIEIPKRPSRHDDAVLTAAAKELAPKVKTWIGSGRDITLDNVEADLIKALKYESDGYELARALERNSYYQPDAALVEILEGAVFAKIKAHDKLCREWVIENQIQELPVGAKVHWTKKPEGGIGEIVKNHPEGKALVRFESLGHVPPGQLGCQGYLVDWEQLALA